MKARRAVRFFISLAAVLLLAVLAVQTGFLSGPDYASGSITDYQTLLPDVAGNEVRSGVTVCAEVTKKTANGNGSYDYAAEITCAIPADCSEKQIIITSAGRALSGALEEAGITLYPGACIELRLVICNASAQTYAYTAESFYISSADWSTYDACTQSGGLVGFDGQVIPEEMTVYRTANAALAALLGTSDADALYADGALADEVLEEALTISGYRGGLSDLDDYYIDYYNAANGTSLSSLWELPLSYFQALTGGTNAVSEGANSAKNRITETNSRLNAWYYDVFYNVCLGFSALPAEQDNADPDDADANTAYSVGAYMRAYADGGTTPAETCISSAFSEIGAGDEAQWTGMCLQLSDALIGNAFSDYFFAVDLGFALSAAADSSRTGNTAVPFKIWIGFAAAALVLLGAFLTLFVKRRRAGRENGGRSQIF